MINFILNPSANYALVQETILNLIKAHLNPDEYTQTVKKRKRKTLNFSLFIDLLPDVLMSHGAADKNYLWRRNEDKTERLAASIKHILVPGRWLRQRIIKNEVLPQDGSHVHKVGWPRLDELYRLQAEYDAIPKDPHARPKVLWAPTHDYRRKGEAQVSQSSYPGFLDELPLLEKYADVSTSLHPRNRTSKEPTLDQLITTDVVISDFGTMVYEAWALGKPVIFPDWIIRDPIMKYMRPGVSEKYIFESNIGIHAKSMRELIDAVHSQRVIDDGTRAFVNDYIEPKFRGKSAKRIADVLRKLDRKRR